MTANEKHSLTIGVGTGPRGAIIDMICESRDVLRILVKKMREAAQKQGFKFRILQHGPTVYGDYSYTVAVDGVSQEQAILSISKFLNVWEWVQLVPDDYSQN